MSATNVDEVDTKKGFEGWALLELMGHRRLAGHLAEEQIAGVAFIRIDVPAPDDDAGTTASQFYAPGAVYCITPTTEEVARAFARRSQPTPVSRFELAPPTPRPDRDEDDDF